MTNVTADGVRCSDREQTGFHYDWFLGPPAQLYKLIKEALQLVHQNTTFIGRGLPT